MKKKQMFKRDKRVLIVLNAKEQKTGDDWQELAALYENIGATEKANAAHNQYKQLLKKQENDD